MNMRSVCYFSNKEMLVKSRRIKQELLRQNTQLSHEIKTPLDLHEVFFDIAFSIEMKMM